MPGSTKIAGYAASQEKSLSPLGDLVISSFRKQTATSGVQRGEGLSQTPRRYSSESKRAQPGARAVGLTVRRTSTVAFVSAPRAARQVCYFPEAVGNRPRDKPPSPPHLLLTQTQLLGAFQTMRSSYFCNYHTHPPPLSESGRRPRLTKYSFLFFPLRSRIWGTSASFPTTCPPGAATPGDTVHSAGAAGRCGPVSPGAAASLSTDQGARL